MHVARFLLLLTTVTPYSALSYLYMTLCHSKPIPDQCCLCVKVKQEVVYIAFILNPPFSPLENCLITFLLIALFILTNVKDSSFCREDIILFNT